MKDIACEYKYCLALIERDKKSELKKWGKYLADKQEPKADRKRTAGDYEVKIYSPEIFPALRHRFNTHFESIYTGPNHSCGINAQNGKVYVWGHNNLQNRLGLKYSSDNEKAREEPVPLAALERVLLRNTAYNRPINYDGQGDQDVSIDNRYADNESQSGRGTSEKEEDDEDDDDREDDDEDGKLIDGGALTEK